MAAWPERAELARVLDVVLADYAEDDELITTLDRVLASAIARVKVEVGNWDEYTDEPSDSLAQAALRMAELIALRPEAATVVASDPTYHRLLFGHRRRFGIA
jgi:hypothetical protein